MERDWKYDRRRQRLVQLLREKGIRDERVLAAIGRVQRQQFVDEALVSRAYLDEALPIGLDQTISQPFTVAYQTEIAVAGLDPGARILEVGTGSGYQAAVLCELGMDLYSVERLEPLYRRTRDLLRSLGYRIKMRCGDGTEGWPAFAPYDAIIVTAGAIDVPEALLRQLRTPQPETTDGPALPGGVLIIPVGGIQGQTMKRIVRTGPDSFDTQALDDFRFVPLIPDS
jgi:protein-L-isoaspartate(D-aspartate) O-methyltransferase